MEDTYIITYRSILNWRWADNPNMMALWWRLLLEANYTANDWQDRVINRGQLVTSVAKLSVESGLTTKQIRLCLERLQKTGEIELETTNKYTIVTICNYDSYQSFEQQEGQTKGKQKTNEGQTKGKQKTNKGQTKDKQRATTKESKESKERKEINISPLFVPPTVDEVAAYCQERNNGVDPQRFCDFYQTKGWMVGKNRMKDWKAAVRTWERRDGVKPAEQDKQKEKWQTVRIEPKQPRKEVVWQ